MIQKKEPRVLKGYKVRLSDYNRAMKRARREKSHLATLLEQVVIAYGNGEDIAIMNSGIKVISGQPQEQLQ